MGANWKWLRDQIGVHRVDRGGIRDVAEIEVHLHIVARLGTGCLDDSQQVGQGLARLVRNVGRRSALWWPG